MEVLKLDSSRIILEENKTVEDYSDLICNICLQASLEV